MDGSSALISITPCGDGSVFHREGGKCYVISQASEPVLEIELGGDSRRAAVLAWHIGNLHFPVEVTDLVIRCADDPGDPPDAADESKSPGVRP